MLSELLQHPASSMWLCKILCIPQADLLYYKILEDMEFKT